TFITGEYYHIFNRGVEKRDIFIDDGDFLRFIHYLYVLNDDQPLSAEFRQRVDLTYEVRPRRLKRELLVDIFTFCLMPNHYHIFLRQRVDNGISKFMQKLGTAESMFFNAKYKHSGSIFQGKFKSVLVKGESQTIVLPNYQHLNPIDLIEPGWKENGIKNPRRAIEFLENYRWSSYLDYVGKKNFPSIINQEFLRGIIGGPEEFKGIIKGIIFDKAISNKFLKESKSLTID
ncbi:transposase, partial [Patescibacteria group bacterium]|nr:transposase [Patescibacteria group bacterium]